VPFDTSFGNSALGAWENDEFGLPAFRYDGCTSGACTEPNDVFHQLGNGTVTALAHAGGYVELFSAKTFYRFMNHYDPAAKNLAGGFGWIRDGGDVWSTLYDDRPPSASYERRFGMGYFKKTIEHGDLRVEQYVYAAPGTDEALLEHVAFTNLGKTKKAVSYVDYWDVAWWLLRYDNVVTPASGYDPALVKTSYDRTRGVLKAVSQSDPHDADVPSLTTDPSPKATFVAWLGGAPDTFDTVQDAFFGAGNSTLPDAVRVGALTGSVDASGTLSNGEAALVTGKSFSLDPGEHHELDILYGVAPRGEEDTVIARYQSGEHNRLPGVARDWAERIPRVDLPTKPWVNREMAWSAYYLLSGMVREDFFDTRVINQGSFYQYVWGANAGPRASLRHLFPIIYLEPEAAREVLVYYLRAMSDAGEVPYATAGYGAWQPFGFQPSDSSLWLLWAAAEYVNATRDFAFLHEMEDFYCAARRGGCGSATVYDMLKRAYAFQKGVVGTGGHGLIRLMNSDWDDTLVSGGADAAKTHELGESTMNTALALIAYPKLAALADHEGDATFATSVRSDTASLGTAMAAEWRGDFFNRAYATAADGSPIEVGAENLWLASNAMALLAEGALSTDQATRLVAKMRSDLFDPSPLGLAAAGAPITPGLGTAGFWYSLAGPAVEGLARLEVPDARALAWSAFLAQTLAGHAETYPDIWYGTFSGPDMYYTPLDAPTPPAPGETWCFIPKTLCMADFPVTNMFSHSEPLLSSLRMVGVTVDEQGLTIDPALPLDTFSWQSRVLSVGYTPTEAHGTVSTLGDDVLELRVRPPSKVSLDRVAVRVGEHDVPFTSDQGKVRFELPVKAGSIASWSVGNDPPR
jgi:hypothetical protein